MGSTRAEDNHHLCVTFVCVFCVCNCSHISCTRAPPVPDPEMALMYILLGLILILCVTKTRTFHHSKETHDRPTSSCSPLVDYQITLPDPDPPILQKDKCLSIFHWLSHLRKPFFCTKHILPPSDKNYHLLIKLLLGNQVELNPGPRTPRWPCGTCGKAVTWKSKALECDSCRTWYHINCQGQMTNTMYALMDNSNLSWHCLKCGLPNFTSSYFQNDPITSSNNFSILSCDSPGKPTACSSPKPDANKTTSDNHTHRSPRNQNTNKPKQKTKSVKRPLNIISLNFQSLKNKKPELDFLIDSINPDIVIGTETWLDPSVSSYEFFPANHFTVYRKDRQPNKKGQSHGGVLIAVRNEFQSSEVKELQTNCEIVWVELTIQNTRKLLISSFYRPQPNDKVSLEQLNLSLSRITPNSRSVILVGGDFNLGNIDWKTSSIIPGKTNIKHH